MVVIPRLLLCVLVGGHRHPSISLHLQSFIAFQAYENIWGAAPKISNVFYMLYIFFYISACVCVCVFVSSNFLLVLNNLNANYFLMIIFFLYSNFMLNKA